MANEVATLPVQPQRAAAVSMDDMVRMAQAVANSGLFGMKTQDQALALMMVAVAEQKHPAIIARDFDIIQGRAAKKSEAMLRDFIEAGGKVEWHTLDDTIADATFSHPSGGSVRLSWDLERARKAGLERKDNYLKYPRAMLRSRVVAEGCRAVCAVATSGLMTIEEAQDAEPAVPRVVVTLKEEIKAEPLPDDQATFLLEQVSSAPDIKRLKESFQNAYKAAKARGDNARMAEFKAAYDSRKAALEQPAPEPAK